MKAGKRTFKPLFAIALVMVTAAACNKNSTSWANRKYQDMIARYNVYYNGTEKLKEAKATLALNHQDNYDQVLDVFPYGDEQQAKAQEAAMDEVIKKGSKIIVNRPVSKWVDDGYLLVGKGYFFKADYYAAIETFQYINTRYKDTEIAQEATIWILKSYLMLERYDDAEALVALLKNQKSFPPRLVGLYSAAAAQVYIKQKKYPPALDYIRIALGETKKRYRTRRARYKYITAQLFERTGRPDSAKLYLEEVIRLNPPYDMAFNAKISLARNYNPNDPGQVRRARRYLRGMLRDDKNISYYDQIYYQLGVIEKRTGNGDKAIENFRLSLQNSQNNQNQKAVTYLALADLYFNIPEYTLAQQYYDSTVQVIQPEFEDYDNIVKKQSVLSELIKYKVIVDREDSLQRLAKLSPNELAKRVDKWIKEEAERKKRAEEEKENQQNNGGFGTGGFPGAPGAPGIGQPQANSGGSNWYFYNPQQVSIGYSEFTTKWGRRKLTDDWRWSGKEKKTNNTNNNQNNSEDDPKGEDSELPTAKKDPELEKRLANIPEAKRKYYRDIPFSEDDRILSDAKIANGLYNIGVIYYEKLNDIPEAIKAFEELLNRFPGNEYEARTYYYLYKIYDSEENVALASKYKKLLIDKYPDSDFALLVNDNPILKQNTIAIEPYKKDFYNTTLDLFNRGKYIEVKSRKTVADTMFSGISLYPKYMLLYAMSVGKTDSVSEYKKELQNIITQYPATDISKRAKELLDAAARLEEGSKPKGRDEREDAFKYEPDELHFVVVVFPKDKGDAKNIQIKISDFNQSSFPNNQFQIIPSILNDKEQIIIIRSFEGKDKAQDYKKQLESFHGLLMGSLDRKEVYYGLISPKNYAELIKIKDIEPYKSFYNRYYR